MIGIIRVSWSLSQHHNDQKYQCCNGDVTTPTVIKKMLALKWSCQDTNNDMKYRCLTGDVTTPAAPTMSTSISVLPQSSQHPQLSQMSESTGDETTSTTNSNVVAEFFRHTISEEVSERHWRCHNTHYGQKCWSRFAVGTTPTTLTMIGSNRVAPEWLKHPQ